MRTVAKRISTVILSGVFALSLLAGCSQNNTQESVSEPANSESNAEQVVDVDPNGPTDIPNAIAGDPDDADAMPNEAPIEVDGSNDGVEVRIGVLKGPSGMGMAYLVDLDDQGALHTKYEFTLLDAPDKINPLLINGELDIAAVPVNVAALLSNKTNGEVKILSVSTLGVLHVLAKGEEITSVADLKGKTIYATGQGATPEYVLRYILQENGINPDTDVTIEFMAEHAELATQLAAGKATIAVLPEPFVTTVTMQNADIKIALDLTKEWETVTGGAVQTTGCVVARKEFIEAHPDVIKEFLSEYKASCDYVNTNTDEAAALIEKYEIIAKAAVAKQAIPRCSIQYLDGSEMKTAVSKYLAVLFTANPQSVGGALPDDAFYYQG